MSEAEQKIRAYLASSAGTGNQPSDHTILCFIGMIETGEATWQDFRNAARSGRHESTDWLVKSMREMMEKLEDERERL